MIEVVTNSLHFTLAIFSRTLLPSGTFDDFPDLEEGSGESSPSAAAAGAIGTNSVLSAMI